MFMHYELTTDVKYCQCKLQKGDMITTTWIPEKYAVKGKYIKLLDDNGWQVIEAGIPIDGNYVFRHERDYMKQRKASDI